MYRDLLEGLIERTRNQKNLEEYQRALSCPSCPKSMEYLWAIFLRLRRRKSQNGFGVPAIEWPDIDAFVRNSRITLTPWEIEIVEELDDLYLASKSGGVQE